MRANDGGELLTLGRMATSVFTLLLVLLVFAAGYEMFGPAAGPLGLLLICFEPTVLAHGALVTTDMGVSACMFLAVYALYRYVGRPGGEGWWSLGSQWWLALAAKLSGIIVLPIVAVCAAVDLLMDWDARRARRLAGAIGFGVAVGYVVLCGFYGFRYGARTGGLTMTPPLPGFAAMLPLGRRRVW